MARPLTWLAGLLPFITVGQPGTLDPEFGQGGIVLTEFFGMDDQVRAVLVQPDEKVLGVGWVDDGGLVTSFAMRLLDDGSPDPGFTLDGLTLLPFTGQSPYAYAVGLQSDGGIIIGGLIYDASMDGNAMVVRLRPDGELDEEFGEGGLVSLSYNAEFGLQSAWAMEVMADDRIVLVGEEGENGLVCARLNADGSLDETFGNGGVALTGVPFSTGLCVHVDNDGSVLAGGYRLQGNSDLMLARFDNTGVLDPDFGTEGVAILDLNGGETEFMHDVDLMSDGRIAVCGSRAFDGLDDQPAVAVFTADGQPDPSFGTGGMFFHPYNDPQWGQARSIVAQPDGKLLVCGFRAQTGGPANNDFFLMRLLEDGSFDPAFADAGHVHTDVSGAVDRAYAMTLAADGSIVVAGYGNGFGTESAFVRYVNDIGSGLPSTRPVITASFHPNPASTQVLVRSPVEGEAITGLEILCPDGRSVHRMTNTAGSGTSLTLDIPPSLCAGTYVLRIHSDRTMTHTSLIVER